MSSMPQSTACVLGLRAGRENAKPAELSRQARRLRQKVPPGDGFDALPGRVADLFTRTYQLGVWPTRRHCRSPRWQCQVLEVIGRQLALRVSPDAIRYIVSILERKAQRL